MAAVRATIERRDLKAISSSEDERRGVSYCTDETCTVCRLFIPLRRTARCAYRAHPDGGGGDVEAQLPNCRTRITQTSVPCASPNTKGGWIHVHRVGVSSKIHKLANGCTSPPGLTPFPSVSLSLVCPMDIRNALIFLK